MVLQIKLLVCKKYVKYGGEVFPDVDGPRQERMRRRADDPRERLKGDESARAVGKVGFMSEQRQGP
jgi:hypothetical protein